MQQAIALEFSVYFGTYTGTKSKGIYVSRLNVKTGMLTPPELAAELPGCKIILADGEYFSWYGSRLLDAPAYFKKLVQSCY